MSTKHVYFFGGKTADGNGKMKELLGGKGANLAEMSVIGIPVPPGFTITTEVCAAYYEHGQKLPEAVMPAGRGGPQARSRRPLGKKFGDPADPLLVSRPLRRRAVDAGHDEHDPQPRPDRRLASRGWPRRPATRGSPTTAIAASSTCSARPRWASSTRHFEHELHALKEEKERQARHRPRPPTTSRSSSKRYKAVYKKHVGERLPAGPEGAALAGHQGRLQ